VDHLFVFCGNGVVKDFIGKYSEYRTFMKDYEAGQKAQKAAETKAEPKAPVKESPAPARKKLSFNEKREFEALGGEIEALTAEKASLEEQMNSGALPYDALQAATLRYGEVSALLDEKELRWLELSERA
jgi:ATP-binding cassette subfamily F protein uup